MSSYWWGGAAVTWPTVPSEDGYDGNNYWESKRNKLGRQRLKVLRLEEGRACAFQNYTLAFALQLGKTADKLSQCGRSGSGSHNRPAAVTFAEDVL
jgi:hypothetical protein